MHPHPVLGQELLQVHVLKLEQASITRQGPLPQQRAQEGRLGERPDGAGPEGSCHPAGPAAVGPQRVFIRVQGLVFVWGGGGTTSLLDYLIFKVFLTTDGNQISLSLQYPLWQSSRSSLAAGEEADNLIFTGLVCLPILNRPRTNVVMIYRRLNETQQSTLHALCPRLEKSVRWCQINLPGNFHVSKLFGGKYSSTYRTH